MNFRNLLFILEFKKKDILQSFGAKVLVCKVFSGLTNNPKDIVNVLQSCVALVEGCPKKSFAFPICRSDQDSSRVFQMMNKLEMKIIVSIDCSKCSEPKSDWVEHFEEIGLHDE